jgi:hypothetical protein
VVAGDGEVLGQAGEDTLARMPYRRGLAVGRLRGAHDLAAEGLGDGLVPEADAEHRHPAAEVANDVHRNAGLVGGTGAGRDDDVIGGEGLDVAHRERVIAEDAQVGAERAEGLGEVIGKRVIVVDHQNHGHDPCW